MNLRLVRTVSWALLGVALVALLVMALVRRELVADGTADEPPFYANFQLTDHAGAPRSQEDFAGQWLLVFFGFANCPDICPTTLAEVAGVMDGLGDAADRVQPLFFTVDPERDTAAELADFVPRFHPRLIGLTGTPEQVAQTADSFHIYYDRIEEAAAPGGYTMGHSSQLFLFGPDGGYVTAWQYGTPADEIVTDLLSRIGE